MIRSSRFRGELVFLGLFLALGFGPTKAQVEEMAIGDYAGPGGCAGSNCHNEEEPGREFDILQTELQYWSSDDSHRLAYEDLKTEESRRIARILGLPSPPEQSKECLTCHSLPADRLDIVDRGVSCEGCHGPAGGWLKGHARASWTHQQSVDRGMIDLRDLTVRTETCLRCHLGDGKRAREVDHELLAAGHPELLFELWFYTETPDGARPHWKPFDALRDQTGRRDTHGPAAWGVGQLESFRLWLMRVDAHYRSSGWPEFTEMSCESCHHSLATGKSRQTRGYPLTPGLPLRDRSRWVALRHLVREVAGDRYDALRRDFEAVDKMAGLNEASKAEMAAAVSRAVTKIEALLPAIDGASYDEAMLRKLISAIAHDEDVRKRGEFRDALQVVFSLEALVDGLFSVAASPPPDTAFDRLDELRAVCSQSDAFDARKFVTALDGLLNELR